MRWLVAALVALAFSGCLDDGTTDDMVVEDPVEDVASLQNYDATFDLMLHKVQVNDGAAVAVGTGIEEPNCLQFHKDDLQRAENITVTMAWDAKAPVYDRLELILHGEGTRIDVQGTSPLVIEADEVVPDTFFESMLVIAQLEYSGVAVQQPVQITLTLDYEGSEDLVPEFRGCTWG